MIRAFIKNSGLLLAFAGVLGGCSGAVPESAKTWPNIVFILADDHAAWAWGTSGNEQIATPNMDRIAREGARLPNAFVATPVCSPARAELMTSRYSTELGITDWINATWEAPHLLHPLEPDLGLDPSTVTWTEVLDAAGYATGLFGKWHLGMLDQFHPTRTGYDEFFGFRDGGTSPTDPILEEDGEPKAFKGFTTDIITDHALGFISEHRGEPFMLSVQPNALAFGNRPVEQDSGSREAAQVRFWRTEYVTAEGLRVFVATCGRDESGVPAADAAGPDGPVSQDCAIPGLLRNGATQVARLDLSAASASSQQSRQPSAKTSPAAVLRLR